MWKKIIVSVSALIALFLGYVALQSPHYEVSRQVAINAPAEKIFPFLNNPKLAEQWAPWQEVDPKAQMIHSGPEAGVGARTNWDADGPLGTGSATIKESIPNERVGIDLEYVKPMKMKQYAEYLVQSQGAQTLVTWKVSGENNFFGRVMCSFMNMDKMVGGMFEQGLNKLKTLMEKQN